MSIIVVRLIAIQVLRSYFICAFRFTDNVQRNVSRCVQGVGTFGQFEFGQFTFGHHTFCQSYI